MLDAGMHELIVEKREAWPGGGIQPRLDALCFTRRPLAPADAEVAVLLAGKRPCSSARDCDDGDACTLDACEAAGSTCTHAARTCDDRNPCTVDTCDENGGCSAIAEADGAPCDDGLACTEADVCKAATCAGADACPGAQACNKTTGACGPPPIAVDQHSAEIACSSRSDRLAASIVLEDAASKVLVVLAACATNDNPGACNLSAPYAAEFAGARLRFAGQATSASAPVVTSGIYYLLADELDEACRGSYPCVGSVELELRSGASTIDALSMGAVLLRNALQDGPQAVAGSAAAQCGESVRTVVPAGGTRAIALAVGAARVPAFGALERPMREELAGACGPIASQITSRALRGSQPTDLDAALPAPAACSHAAAVFATLPD
jgi:hypothetical protein